jgi:hypothetical protein
MSDYNIKQIMPNPTGQIAMFYYHTVGEEFDVGGITTYHVPLLALVERTQQGDKSSVQPLILIAGNYYTSRDAIHEESAFFCGFYDADTRGGSLENIAKHRTAHYIKNTNKRGAKW